MHRIFNILIARKSDHIRKLHHLINHADHINHDASKMIEGVIEISDMQARDIMLPRSKMIVLDKNQSLDDILSTVMDSGHSRFPVTDGNRDEVIGMLLAKDLLKFISTKQNTDGNCISQLIRPACFVPESKRLNALLKEFRLQHKHLAIVVDEYDGVAGLITIEDILEQIVGAIEDEHDDEQDEHIQKVSRQKFMISSLTSIEEFNEFFGSNLPEHHFDTIGGLITHKLGHVPKKGERVDIGHLHFKVVKTSQQHIKLLKLKIGHEK